MITVGLLEDEVDLRSEIAEYLQSLDYQVLEAGTVKSFQPLIDQIQIAIIDIGLPDGDGFQVANNINLQHTQIGVIMLTAHGEIDDKIHGLSMGADQYLVKPIKFEELAANISALSRRIIPKSWEINTLQHQLISPQNIVDELSPYEFTLLELLAKHPGNIVSRTDIAEAFGVNWIEYDERHLDQLISRLRKRWKTNNNITLPIKTAHGQGYMFSEHIKLI